MTQLPLPLRLSGAVWGHLVGDAVGVPYEFKSRSQIGEVRFGVSGTHGQPPGTWSDDGALMLALLDSLLTNGFDLEDQGRRALEWYRHGAYAPGAKVFDIGGTTRIALEAIAAGASAEQSGPAGERNQSNGSLMRILPVALWGHGKRAADLVSMSARASGVTHGHPVAKVVCAMYVLAVDALLSGASPSAAIERATFDVRVVLKEANDEALVVVLDDVRNWRSHHVPSGRGGAVDAFWSAWTAFEGAGAYQETIERAISYGNDTDTTAAIAGGLAGAYWGLDSIPADWLRRMRDRHLVEPLIDRLLASHGWRTSATNRIRVDWVDLAQVPKLANATGRLGMTFLPGKQYVGWHGPAWRDLERDLVDLRSVHGCDSFLLLVEDHELESTRTTQLERAMAAAGIRLVRHPVVDMSIPSDRRGYASVLAASRAAIEAGETVVVACRGGLGRTGTAIACLLVDAGLEPDAAIALTRASRRNTIERGVQVDWVRNWVGAGSGRD